MGFKMVAGGLLTGLGTGMVAQAKVRREEALARAKALREERQRQEDFAFEREKIAGEQKFEREQTKAEQKFELSRDEAKAERERGQYATTVTGEGGELYGVSKGLGVKDLGIKVAQDEKGSKGGGAGDGLTASDKSLMERVSNNYWSKLNAEGQFILPEESRDHYTQTSSRAEELAGLGVPVLKASHIAAQSISGPLSEEKARKVAEAEAREQFGGWTQGDEREQYVKQRTPELMRESREAERTYQRLVRGGGAQNRSGQQTSRAGPAQPKPQAQSGQKASQAPPAPRDRAARTVGQVYRAPDGRLIEWTGQGWRLVEQ